MRALQATITERGQVTIPAAVQRILGVGPRDKVVFEIEPSGTIRIVPVRYTVASAYGAVAAIGREDDLKAVSREAREDRADQVVREVRGEA
jgi:AbrB family looped-hinge helix DNA binding protein